MKIVLDTNIIISSIIKNSTTRKIILESKSDFYYPLPSFYEINKHKSLILRKSKLDEASYNTLIFSLFNKIKIVPLELIKPYISDAYRIIGKIDPNDVIFIATSLYTNSPIWSEDKHFQKQNQVKIFTTKEIISNLSSS